VVRLKSKGRHYEFGTYATIAEAAVVAESARRQMFGSVAP
jgi:hypothetical protein